MAKKKPPKNLCIGNCCKGGQLDLSAISPLKSTAVCCRSQSLQRAKMSLKNFRTDYDSLNNWLSRVPNYEVRETDDARQVESKLKSQRVRPLTIHASAFLKHQDRTGLIS